MRRGRAAVAAALVAATIAGLLAAWFAAGWGEVRARQREVAGAPAVTAATRGAELARELRGELAALIAREGDRPYFHYQSLFHDPRSSNAQQNVAPTPLASGPVDPLVVGYFQLDARGRATTPTINDDAPELSEPAHLAQNRAFRASVTADLAGALAPALVADASGAAKQVVHLDANVYTQNAAPTQIYQQQQALAPGPAPVPPAGQVTITVSSLTWRTLPFAGAPALVAARSVRTPDGTLQQGFVVDRAALTRWLAARAAGATIEVGDGGAGNPGELAPGWRVSVPPEAGEVAVAERDAAAVARDFVMRFAAIGALAALAGALAVLLVVRAERLARERSQFAAAAAHELRTPLAGLQLYGDMLADGLGDPAKAADYARRMSEEAARLGRVVSNVLGFAQLERGNLSVDARADALDDALRELAARAEPALTRAGCALELAVEPGLRGRLDRDALARIIGNLLDNAEKYGRGAADRAIQLSARRTTSGAAEGVEVVVADRGPGVAPVGRARLFRPFARGAAADGPAGLGLGLALSRSLARAMGGELEYRDRPGGGAELRLRLRA